MGLKDFFSKTSMLKPISAKIFPSAEQQAKKKELDVISKRNELDALKLDREKKLFSVK